MWPVSFDFPYLYESYIYYIYWYIQYLDIQIWLVVEKSDTKRVSVLARLTVKSAGNSRKFAAADYLSMDRAEIAAKAFHEGAERLALEFNYHKGQAGTSELSSSGMKLLYELGPTIGTDYFQSGHVIS